MKDQNVVTKEGLEELKNELNRRIEIDRVKIAEELSAASMQGDLSENATYKTAMEDKEFNENRISELQKIIAEAVVVEGNKNDDTAGFGERIVVKRLSDDKIREYILVGENEADPLSYKISIKSPIGNALLNKDVGTVVKVEMPNGIEEFEILEIK